MFYSKAIAIQIISSIGHIYIGKMAPTDQSTFLVFYISGLLPICIFAMF